MRNFLHLLLDKRVLLTLCFIYFLLILYINSTYTFIGRGDYANYANVARNLTAGKGFSVDYLAWHFIKYPSINHPEDMWPLMQPVWIALSYMFLGITPFAARFPNAVFLILLTITTYVVSKKLFDQKIAIASAFLTATNYSLLLYTTAWITSDIALALFSLILFYLGHKLASYSRISDSSLYLWLLFGLIGGLGILQKPMGALLVGIYFWYFIYVYKKDIKSLVKPLFLLVLGVGVSSGWFFVRNLYLFQTLFLPVEHYLGYLIKYVPYENIFGIYYGNPPSFGLWQSIGLIKFLKINLEYFRYAIDTFIYKELLMPYTVLVLSILGISKIEDKHKHFFTPAVILLVIMSILMGTYWHYESRYYSMLIPVFNILAALVVLRFFNLRNFKHLLLLGTLGVITLIPSFKFLYEGVKPKTTDPSLTAYTWIKDNTPKTSVIMTLTPWELNFHSERQAVVIPFADKESILWMAQKYKADYLELEFLKEIKREALKDQYLGKETTEFDKVYSDPNNAFVYKINWEQIKLDPSRTPSWY